MPLHADPATTGPTFRCDTPRHTRTYFVADATRAAWDGDVLRVAFREVGLPVGATTTTITITGDVTADATCHTGEGRYTMSSQAVVTDEAVYPVDAAGAIQGMVVLHLAAHLTAVGADQPRPDVHRSFTITIRDPSTGAAAYLS